MQQPVTQVIMASSSASSHVSLASKPPRILACVLCQHRKIKCDRNFPCSNCTKANVKCTPSTPAPARKRRRPNQDLQERLARCEELLKEYVTEKPEGSVASPATSTPYNDSVYRQWQPVGKLVKEDGGFRFMDSVILGTIYDELRAMREIINTDDVDESISDTMTPDDNSELLLGADSPGVATEDLWPDPSHVFRLWQIYLDRVNPLTKIIHVPTLQPYVAEATAGCQNLPKNIEALLFSIYLMGAVALTQEECRLLLGYSREEALQRFSSGVRIALARIGFLKSYDLTTLQALVIYLISLQGRYNRHATWILNGVVIRIAQKMGLHHDGEVLGLGPFESEMRRRLWWQIIMIDAKYAMMTGLSHSLLPRNWDIKQPKNLNDADLFPSATEPFQDREGPTEMIFCLINNRIGKFLVESPGFEGLVFMFECGAPDSSDNPQLQEFRRLVEKLGADLLELLDKYCDPSAGPVHELAVEMKAQMLEKLGQLVAPSTDRLDLDDGPPDANKHAFRIALSALEHGERSYEMTKDKGFLWLCQTHFQIDVVIYLAGQLCHRTEGKLVERAWKQIARVYQLDTGLWDTSNKANQTLARFILKAWGKREEVLRNRLGQTPEVPDYIEKLRHIIPTEDMRPQPTPPQHMAPNLMASAQMNPPETSFDQMLGSYLETVSIDWDMFGDMPTTQQSMPPFRYSMGPF